MRLTHFGANCATAEGCVRFESLNQFGSKAPMFASQLLVYASLAEEAAAGSAAAWELGLAEAAYRELACISHGLGECDYEWAVLAVAHAELRHAALQGGQAEAATLRRHKAAVRALMARVSATPSPLH